MELSDYIQVTRRRWRILVGVFVATVVIAAALTGLMTPQFSGRSSLYVSTVSTEGVTDLAQGANFTQRQVTTYADVATTPYVFDPVIEDLGLEQTAQQLATQIVTQPPANTSLLDISVTDPDPDQALAIATSVSQQLVATIEALDQVAPGHR